MSGLAGAVEAVDNVSYAVGNDGKMLSAERAEVPYGSDTIERYTIHVSDGQSITAQTKPFGSEWEPHTFLISNGGKTEEKTLYVHKDQWAAHKARFAKKAQEDNQKLAKITASKPPIASQLFKPGAAAGKKAEKSSTAAELKAMDAQLDQIKASLENTTRL
jgi:hypothetical protein